jgi:hypothetical protein
VRIAINLPLALYQRSNRCGLMPQTCRAQLLFQLVDLFRRRLHLAVHNLVPEDRKQLRAAPQRQHNL